MSNVDSEQQIFWATLRIFAKNFAEKYNLFYISFWFLTLDTNPGLTSNKPVHYQLWWAMLTLTECCVRVNVSLFSNEYVAKFLRKSDQNYNQSWSWNVCECCCKTSEPRQLIRFKNRNNLPALILFQDLPSSTLDLGPLDCKLCIVWENRVCKKNTFKCHRFS